MTQTDLITRNVIVEVSDASGVLRPGAILTANLSEPDTDGTRVITPELIRVEVTEDGASMPLWPNTRGVRGTSYRIRSHLNQQIHDLGLIQVQDTGDQALGELLLASSVIVPGQIVVATTKEQYDTLVTAVLATGVDRERAETAAGQAALDVQQTGRDRSAVEGWATRIDLGALDDAVEQTGEDRDATGLWAGIASAYGGTARVAALQALDAASDAAASKADAALSKAAAAGSAGTATMQAGVATAAASTATTQAGVATTKAGEAASSAGIALAQADIATTKASAAAVSASQIEGDREATGLWAGISAAYGGTARVAALQAVDAAGSATAAAATAAEIAPIAPDITTVAANIAGVQDAAAGFPVIQSALLQIAIAFADSQTRYIAAHAFT